MNIDNLAIDAARALIDAGQGAPIPPLDPKRSDRRRNVLAFAMSAAVVIVVVGVAAVFGRMLVEDPELDPANTTVVDTTVVDTTVVATTTPSVQSTTSSTVAPDVVSPEFAANSWARGLVETSGSGDSSMVDVVTSPNLNRSVAVGFVSGGQPAAWTWTDGWWQRIVVEGSEAGGSLVDVTVDTAGFVAVGTLDGQPTVWRSSDGLGFTIDTNLPPPSRGVASPAAVTVHGDGLVVVGVGFEGLSEGHAEEDNMDGVVWIGRSGSWQVIQSSAFATTGFGASDPITGLVDLTSGSAGLVAVGFQNEGPAAWLSSDGLSWERVDLAIDVRLDGVAHFDERYFAWGTTGFRGSPTNDGMILMSTDGRDWQPVSGDFSGAGGSDGYQNVDFVGHDAELGYYAVGSDHKEFTNIGGIALWQSADGTTWDRVEHDDTVFGTLTEFGYGTATAVTFVDGDVLAVGLTGQAVPEAGGTRCCDLTAAAWIGKP